MRGFYVFIACIALGVMAIAGVGSVAASLGDGLAREGRVILGGDLAFTLIQREASADERAFLARAGTISRAATLRAMARTEDGRTALVEIKAVDGAYPLFGTVGSIRPSRSTTALAQRDGVFGAAADPALLARLDLQAGDAHHARRRHDRNPRRAAVGARQARRRHRLRAAPAHQRTMRSRATGLLQPGSLVRWHLSAAACPTPPPTRSAVIAAAGGATCRKPAGRSAPAATRRPR